MYCTSWSFLPVPSPHHPSINHKDFVKPANQIIMRHVFNLLRSFRRGWADRRSPLTLVSYSSTFLARKRSLQQHKTRCDAWALEGRADTSTDTNDVMITVGRPVHWRSTETDGNAFNNAFGNWFYAEFMLFGIYKLNITLKSKATFLNKTMTNQDRKEPSILLMK